MDSDLIRRKELLERLEKIYGTDSIVDKIMLRFLKKLIRKQPTVGWIPCSERLPKEEGMYLITSNLFGSLEVQYVFYSENVQMFVCNGTSVAWMPLPSPYKAGDIDG